MTRGHRYADMEVFGRSGTLGEMLALPDKEGRPANVDAMILGRRFIDNFGGNDELAGCVEPLGISSRDGWKDECIKNLSRSRSLPASCTTIGSPRTGLRCESHWKDRHILPKELMQQESIEAVKGKPNKRESSSSRSSRSRIKRSHFSEYTSADHSDTSPEINFSRKLVQSSVTYDDPVKPYHLVSEITSLIVTDVSFLPENVLDVATKNVAMPSKPTDSELPAYVLVEGYASSDTGALTLQV